MLAKILSSIRQSRLRTAVARYKTDNGVSSALRLAKALAALGHTSKALKILSAGIHQFPDANRLRRLYHKIAAKETREELAVVDLELHEQPSLELYSRACDLCCSIGDFSRAAGYAEEASDRYPDAWETDFVLGKFYFHRYNARRKAHDLELARAQLEASLEGNPQHYEALLLLALTLARCELFSDALSTVQTLLRHYPGDSRGRRLRSSILQLRESVDAESRREVETSTAEDDGTPESVDFEDQLGNAQEVLEQLSRLPGAVGLFLYDSAGQLAASIAKESETFEFGGDCEETMRSMARGCLASAARIGLGELQSCNVCGESWQLILKVLGPFQFVGFFEGIPEGEALEGEIELALQETMAG